jgi:hypothetical protein
VTRGEDIAHLIDFLPCAIYFKFGLFFHRKGHPLNLTKDGLGNILGNLGGHWAIFHKKYLGIILLVPAE